MTRQINTHPPPCDVFANIGAWCVPVVYEMKLLITCIFVSQFKRFCGGQAGQGLISQFAF